MEPQKFLPNHQVLASSRQALQNAFLKNRLTPASFINFCFFSIYSTEKFNTQGVEVPPSRPFKMDFLLVADEKNIGVRETF